ncbi:MAG: VWA domain-containing protein [Candidatus Aenigmarchaeota archaeon]|nr:VWA domain-containing protein [Candidatus Aenigmarchaeota archaeon]
MAKARDRPKHSLADLTEKSASALRNPEIIELARTLSPNAIKQDVLWKGGGRRRADSARFLAMLKRDYGEDAFKELVMSRISNGHALKGARSGGNTMSRPSSAVKPEKGGCVVNPGGGVSPVDAPDNVPDPKVLVPLKALGFEATVAGTTAEVVCTQEYENKHTEAVEAIYCFPLPADASVTGCRMTIGKDKTIVAEIKEKAQAKKEYDDAVAAGDHATLMEQKRENIFTMNVGGIEPGEEILVEVRFVQTIPWGADGARFRIPLVVAPRFIAGKPTDRTGDGWSPNTDVTHDASEITPVPTKEGVPYNAAIRVKLSPGFRCKLTCPSHEMLVAEQELTPKRGTTVVVEDLIPNRDFTLVYTPMATVPQVAVHSATLSKESFVLLNIIPPFQADPIPMDIEFVLDVSGSMSGIKIEGLKRLVADLIQKIKDSNIGHHVGIIKFSTHAQVIYPLGDAREQDPIPMVQGLQSENSTYLGTAVKLAYAELAKGKYSGKYMVIVSDGQTTDPVDTSPGGVRMITIGIDTAVNDATLAQIARLTNGVNMNFLPNEDMEGAAKKIVGTLSGPVLTDVKVDAGKDTDAVGVTDVFQNMPAVITVRAGKKAPASVKVTGNDPAGAPQTFDVNLSDVDECTFAPQLWARQKIKETGDSVGVTEVSLKYGVISAHTSFVAISEKQMPGKKAPVRTEIPVEFPDGWNWESVFGQGAAAKRLTHLGSTAARVCASVRRDSVRARRVAGMTRENDMALLEEVCEGSDPARRGSERRGRRPSTTPRTPNVTPLSMPTPPAAPPVTIVPTTAVVDFDPASTDPGDAIIGVLITVERGDRSAAESALGTIFGALTAKEVKGWSDAERAKFLYFVLRIKKFGLSVDNPQTRPIMATLMKFKGEGGWHSLCKQEQGQRANKDVALPSGEEGQYVSWKLGLGMRPTQVPWSMVS